jgi:hypothetical protein
MVTRAGARRTATLVAATALAAIGVGAASVPAYAADDRVSVRASRSFNPGGDGGAVTVSVNKRTKGCVAVRVVLGIRLNGLEANQVQVAAGGQDVGVSGGGGGVVTGQVAPERQRLCERQTATVRYRVAFAEGVSGGTVTFVGEATTAGGAFMGRDTTESKVNAPKESKSPSPKPSKSSKSPTPEPRTSTVAPFANAAKSPAAVGAPPAQDGDGGSGGLSGLDAVVMLGGLGLVGLGAAMLFFLIRRSRADRAEPDPADAPTAVMPAYGQGSADAPTMIIRRIEEQP